MKKMIFILLLFCFSFAQTFSAEQVQTNKIEVSVESFVYGVDEIVPIGIVVSNDYLHNPINYGGDRITIAIIEKTKEKETYLRKGRNVDPPTTHYGDLYLNCNYSEFDFSFNKFLKQSLKSDTTKI